MRLPSKVTSYNESILPIVLILAKKLRAGDMTVLSLFRECRSVIRDVADYFVALEVLFALNKVQLTDQQGGLHYVG